MYIEDPWALELRVAMVAEGVSVLEDNKEDKEDDDSMDPDAALEVS